MTFIKIFKKMLRKYLTLQNQELDRPVPKQKKKGIGLIEDELSVKIMKSSD